MPRKHGCQAPWRPAQVLALIIWFGTLAGFYGLFVPVLPSVAWQTAAVVLYSAASLGVFFAYLWVSLTDPADDTADGPMFCEQCQAYVQRGSRHCKECCKCVLNFDHHCKWVNNCIGSRNYTPFMVLLTSVCAMLAVQIAAGVQLLMLCFTSAGVNDSSSAAAATSASGVWAVTPRLQSAYPLVPSREGYITALCCYLVLLLVALYGLGDLWLLHLVLLARGLTTYDYIMANHDAAVTAAAGGSSAQSSQSLAAVSWRRLKGSLGRRSNQVQDESLLATRAGAVAFDNNSGSRGSRRGVDNAPGRQGKASVLDNSSSRLGGLATAAAAGSSSPHGISPRVLLQVPTKKHRVSLTPCQACMTPQSAIDARQHAVAYQQQQPQADSGAGRVSGQLAQQRQHSLRERDAGEGVAAAAVHAGVTGSTGIMPAGGGRQVPQQQQPQRRPPQRQPWEGLQEQRQQSEVAAGGTGAPYMPVAEFGTTQQQQQQQEQQQPVGAAAPLSKHSSKQRLLQAEGGRKPSVKFAAEL